MGGSANFIWGLPTLMLRVDLALATGAWTAAADVWARDGSEAAVLTAGATAGRFASACMVGLRVTKGAG